MKTEIYIRAGASRCQCMKDGDEGEGEKRFGASAMSKQCDDSERRRRVLATV